MKLRHVLIVLIGVGMLIYSSVDSLPRLALEQATTCKSCHINPGGGGMRNEYGNHAVAFSERTIPQTKKYFEGKYHSPRVADNLLVGFEGRYLVLDDGRIFRMQTDIFANFEPMDGFSYQVRFWDNGITENYALLSIDDKRHWLKVGRFTPTFGLHNEDHKSFNRERLGYGSNVYLDGLAFGTEIGGVEATIEYFNPNEISTGNVQFLKTGYLEPVSYMLGSSIRFTEQSTGVTSPFPPAKSMFGGIAYNRLSLLSEVDLVGRDSDTLIFYASLAGRIEYGLYLIGEYNFFDGDRDYKSGIDEYYRFSIEFFPIPFVQLRPSYTKYTEGDRKDEDDFFLQLYFGY